MESEQPLGREPGREQVESTPTCQEGEPRPTSERTGEVESTETVELNETSRTLQEKVLETKQKQNYHRVLP